MWASLLARLWVYESGELKSGNIVATEFEIGDIVQLKSGGPGMTVQAILSNGHYKCQWFAGKKLESGNFPLGSLKLVSDPQ